MWKVGKYIQIDLPIYMAKALNKVLCPHLSTVTPRTFSLCTVKISHESLARSPAQVCDILSVRACQIFISYQAALHLHKYSYNFPSSSATVVRLRVLRRSHMLYAITFFFKQQCKRDVFRV